MAPPRRPPLTHFLSIPLHTPAALPTLQTTLTTLTTLLSPHLPPAAIRPAVTLHLTLGVMSLPTPEQLQSATSFLSSLDLPAILRSMTPTPAPPPVAQAPIEEGQPPPPPLKITLRNLTCLGPPQRATVLYTAPHDASGRLPRFAEHIRSLFSAAGLLVPETRPLLLHATVVNTVYIRGRGRGRGRGERVTFDAAEALEWGRGRVFAEDVEVAGVCICRMGEARVGGVSQGYLEVARGVLGGAG
ncbi:hypothetical protein P167DRAFT_604336 [Morchella conica CCBAS932]|uniref:A-kinase anchor protein 7-like phosphoesterase domain-containing protein n=1 Tax=Morchella conica CCBAS932 TaxID=1392247 RepID=A0A3N4KU59_9PEZI|nr:hypothetical protein P167DRAFT_604336 [Morchella conica CCBAS932]